jgi:heme-degrading monooxygenase HmoA
MIARHWRGLAKAGQADAYVEHLRSDTLPRLADIAGFVGASVLRRRLDAGVEFVVITTWTSVDAIERFAGPDAEAAVVPDTAAAMMIDYDRRARHYDIVAQLPGGSPAAGP